MGMQGARSWDSLVKKHGVEMMCVVWCTGISGEFTSDELQTFRDCIPNGIRYTETDGKVRIRFIIAAGDNCVCVHIILFGAQVTQKC